MEIYIVGKGPSLQGLDLNKILAGKTVCGINDVYKVIRCDYICFWDNPRYLTEFDGTCWTIAPQENLMKQLKAKGLIRDYRAWKNKGNDLGPETVPNINLSGVLSIGCAILSGFEKIYLMGFDGGYTGDARWFDSDTRFPESAAYETYNGVFSIYNNRGVEIINVVNPEIPSRITCFKTITYNEL